uniref:Putative thyropin n=1 Tax=Ornithodoros moubata TaxID=6938 RepID=Q6QZV4_ORNMO|nr:putative thyropin precursor [Ornithodoros moubata]
MNKLVIAFAVIAFAAINYGVSAASLTDCQLRAERERRVTGVPGHIIPECDENGEYKAKQCFGARVGGASPFCNCFSRDYRVLLGPSTRITNCDCVRERHELQQRQGTRSNAGLPNCDSRTGEYIRG